MKTYRITGKLKARGVNGRNSGPLHIGAPSEQSSFVDRLVNRDSSGCPQLPGTSLCGIMAELAKYSLRAAGISRPDQHPSFTALFGAARGSNNSGQESRLRVLDARLENSSAIIRDRNAINRERGSAENKSLFNEEVIDGAWSFPLVMYLTETGARTEAEKLNAADPHASEPDTLARRLLHDVLCLLETGWSNIGGNSSIGYGRLKLDECCAAAWDRTNPDQVLAFAGDRWAAKNMEDKEVFPAIPIHDAWQFEAADASSNGQKMNSCERLRFHCTLRPQEPFLVKAGYTAETCKTAGSTRGAQENLELRYRPEEIEYAVDSGFCLDAEDMPYVPGSSLRGVLRSRAEQVIRTLAGNEAAWGPKLAQEQGEGFSNRSNYSENDVECLVSRVFGFSALGGRIMFSDAFPVNPAQFDKGRKLLDHVALDRFTGGAADEQKFNARPFFPAGPPGKTGDSGDLKCEIELHDFEPWHLGMLLLLLRDLHLGRIFIGHGKNKGFGRVILSAVKVEALSAPGGLLNEALPADAAALGIFKTFTEGISFNREGYVEHKENKKLNIVFREAEKAMRDMILNRQAAVDVNNEREVSQ